MKRIKKFETETLQPSKLEILAEQLTEAVGVLTPRKERKQIILNFLKEKIDSGEIIC